VVCDFDGRSGGGKFEFSGPLSHVLQHGFQILAMKSDISFALVLQLWSAFQKHGAKLYGIKETSRTCCQFIIFGIK
jgi:hypothetical protein